MAFALPDVLPETVAELDGLLESARANINVIQARHVAGEKLTEEDVAELKRLLDSVDELSARRAEAATSEAQREQVFQSLIDRAASATSPEQPEGEPEQPDQTEGQPEQPAEQPEQQPDEQPDGGDNEQAEEGEVVEGELVTAAAGDSRPVRFGGVGRSTVPDVVTERSKEPGWEIDPNCPGFQTGMGKVGFNQLAQMLDQVRGNSRARNRPNKPSGGDFSAQTLARLRREMPVIEDSHGLVAAIEEATDEHRLPGGSLTAAGGWCAPSEQLYDFCDVPNATDLISVPDITIRRGGIRWPVEPDLTQLFQDFEWFFTEPQLEAVDSGTGEPSAVKTCVDIPCPDEFVELRLAAVGYCVEAGILQTQGWPELIAWFMQSLAQEHLRSLSRRTILDIVNGSTARTIANATTIGVHSALLNSMELQAINLRLNRGLPRTATIEAILPNWVPAVMRADLAMMDDLELMSVTDAQLLAWFAERNIAPQFVADWQTRGTGQLGNLATVAWPTSVQVVMYPAGAWFRALSPIIELGVMYPREQLQVNRYTRYFTEDAIAVGKRCYESVVMTVPICVDGAVGNRVSVTCSGDA